MGPTRRLAIALAFVLVVPACGGPTGTRPPTTTPLPNEQHGLLGGRGWLYAGADANGVGMLGGRAALEIRPSRELRIEAGPLLYGRSADASEAGGVAPSGDLHLTGGAAASASLLFFDPVRLGPYIDLGVGGGASGGYFFPSFGIEAEVEVPFGHDARAAFAGRLFVLPWVPFAANSAAPVVFGAGVSLALDGLPLPAAAPSSDARLRADIDQILGTELEDISARDPAHCVQTFVDRWTRLPAAGEGAAAHDGDGHCGSVELEASWCVAWLGRAGDDYDIDLRAFVGESWSDDETSVRVEDIAGDAWPVVVFCNATEADVTVRVEARRYDDDEPLRGRLARWTFPLPLVDSVRLTSSGPSATLTSPCPRDTSLAAGTCCLGHASRAASETIIPIGPTAPSVRVYAPSIVGFVASVVGADPGSPRSRDTLRWDEPHELAAGRAATSAVSIRLGDGAIGGPFVVCAAAALPAAPADPPAAGATSLPAPAAVPAPAETAVDLASAAPGP